MEQSFLAGFYEGTVLENGYGQIGQYIMRDKTISRDAKVIYAYLISFAGDKMVAFPKWTTICEELGFKSKNTYYKYMNELKERGFIYVKQEKREGKFSKNIYYLVFKKEDVEKVKAEYNKVSTDSQKTGNANFGKRKNWEHNINSSLNINRDLNIEEEETFTQICNKYSEAKGKAVSPYERTKLFKFIEEFKKDIILKAIDVMVEKADKINLSYLQAILQDWHSKGLQTIELVEKHLAEREVQKAKVKQNRENAIKRAVDNKPYIKKDSFTNYPQREYDYDNLEKKLLGWDKQEVEG